MAKINKTDNTNAGENEEQLELCSEPLILIPNSSSFLCDEFFFLFLFLLHLLKFITHT